MPCNYNHLTTDGINNNHFIYMYLVIVIKINFEEKINWSFLELTLDLNSPELELEVKCPELELELKLLVSNGIGIENNGIGIELKKWNWPQLCCQ